MVLVDLLAKKQKVSASLGTTLILFHTAKDWVGGFKRGQAPSDLHSPLASPEYFPIGQRVYFIEIINKTPLCNENCLITNLITKMGVAHTVGPVFLTLFKFCNFADFAPIVCVWVGRSEKVQYYNGINNG